MHALAGGDHSADGIAGRSQGAQPAIVIPAGRVIEEIQVDDQVVRVSTKICTLRGVQRIATAAVALSPGRPVSERQEDPACVLVEPPHIDCRGDRRRQPWLCCPVRCRRGLPAAALPRLSVGAPARIAGQGRRANAVIRSRGADPLGSAGFVDGSGTIGRVPLATADDLAKDPAPPERPYTSPRPGGASRVTRARRSQ